MIILTGIDEKLLLEHLHILRLYYKNQSLIFTGYRSGKAFLKLHDDLNGLIERLEEHADEENLE